jgi:hypothetical protein
MARILALQPRLRSKSARQVQRLIPATTRFRSRRASPNDGRQCRTLIRWESRTAMARIISFCASSDAVTRLLLRTHPRSPTSSLSSL